jgi:hypothetical protein
MKPVSVIFGIVVDSSGCGYPWVASRRVNFSHVLTAEVKKIVKILAARDHAESLCRGSRVGCDDLDSADGTSASRTDSSRGEPATTVSTFCLPQERLLRDRAFVHVPESPIH